MPSSKLLDIGRRRELLLCSAHAQSTNNGLPLSGSRGCIASSSRMTEALRKILLRSQCQLHCNRLSFTSPSSLRALNSRLWLCTRHYPRQLHLSLSQTKIIIGGRVHLFSTHTAFKSGASATTVGAARTAATITSTTPTIIRDLLLQNLQQILLKPRSLPLPRYISPQHYSFTLSELFGHASFILIAASYYTQDFVQLRVMAILGSTAMLAFTYFHPHGRVLWLPLKWNALFIAINAWRVGKVYFLRYRAENLSDEMKDFRREHLGLFDMVDYYNLISMGVEEVFEEGDLIIHQGQANPHIRIVLEGELKVLRDGTLTYVLEKGNFVAEGGLHAGLMLKGSLESCCSIVVGPPFDPTENQQQKQTRQNKNRVRCLRWDRTKMVELLEDSSGNNMRNALKAALSWDIVHKLKMQRHMLTEGRVKDPTTWSRKREEQGISRYASILQSMLRHPEEFRDMCDVLKKYRRIHRIDDVDHKRALAKCGWTEEEFRLGKKNMILDEEDDIRSGVKRYSSKLVRSLLQE